MTKTQPTAHSTNRIHRKSSARLNQKPTAAGPTPKDRPLRDEIMQLTESQRHKLLYPDFRNGFFAADAKHKPVGVRKIPAWCYATLANTSCDMRLRLEDPFEQTTEIMLNLAEWNALIQKLMELRGITPVIAGR